MDNSTKKAILVVDAEPSQIWMTCEKLRPLNIKCVMARTVRDALKFLQTQHFAVVISDVRMPGGGGETLLQAARSRGDKTPFIFQTAFTDEDEGFYLQALGGESYLPKSAPKEDLIETVRKVIESIPNGDDKNE